LPTTVNLTVVVVPVSSPAPAIATSAGCPALAGCQFTYDPAYTPRVASVQPANGPSGTLLTVVGDGFEPAQTVSIGGADCDVELATLNRSFFRCTVGNTPAGQHPIFVQVPGKGIAHTTATFESTLSLDQLSPTGASFGGGNRLTLTGAGFPASADGVSVLVCGRPCAVEQSAYAALECIAPALRTPVSNQVFRNVEPSVLEGTFLGTASNLAALADRDFSTFSTASSALKDTCVVDFALGANQLASVTRIRFFPRLKFDSLAFRGTFLVSEDGLVWTTVATIEPSSHSGWNAIQLASATEYIRYIRYKGPPNSFCQMAELEYHGIVADSSSNACTVEVRVLPVQLHPSRGRDAFNVAGQPTPVQAPQQLEYSQALTPEVTSIAPAWGSSLGGTPITLRGTLFANAVQVEVNGRPCTGLVVVSDVELRCSTSARRKLRAPTVTVILANGGASLRKEAVHFRFLDRWSQVNTWLNDEPPVEGDTVIEIGRAHV
jgi:hypothetical protein